MAKIRYWYSKNDIINHFSFTGNKLKKKGEFKKLINHLRDAAGGDANNLTCHGNSNNNAAKWIKNVTIFLSNCSNYINDMCNTNAPAAPPESVTKPCLDAIATFKEKMNDCSQYKSDGVQLCTCLEDNSLVNNSAVINNCDCK